MAANIPRPYPNVRRVTLANANEWYHATWEAGPLRVSVRPITNGAFYGWETGAGPTQLSESDAYDSGADHYGTLDADQWTELPLRAQPGGHVRAEIFLASATATTVVEVQVEGQ